MSTGPNPHDSIDPTEDDFAASDDLPGLEDAFEPESALGDAVLEDAAEEMPLEMGARSLHGTEAPVPFTDDVSAALAGEVGRGATGLEDAGSDAAIVGEEPEPVVVSRRHRLGDWESELSAHAVGIELKRIEDEVRAILEERDPRRKRKLNGTSRWQELEDDLISWRFSGRFSEDALRRLSELIARRHHLFRHLRFLASTRPTWNS